MFGIMRTRRTSSWSRSSKKERGFPAAMEIMRGFFSLIIVRSGEITEASTFGLTERTTRSQFKISSAALSKTERPNFSASACAFGALISKTPMSFPLSVPEETRPLIIAEAMFPVPMNPVILFQLLSLSIITWFFAMYFTTKGVGFQQRNVIQCPSGQNREYTVPVPSRAPAKKHSQSQAQQGSPQPFHIRAL